MTIDWKSMKKCKHEKNITTQNAYKQSKLDLTISTFKKNYTKNKA